jgi:hypothetical protein
MTTPQAVPESRWVSGNAHFVIERAFDGCSFSYITIPIATRVGLEREKE